MALGNLYKKVVPNFFVKEADDTAKTDVGAELDTAADDFNKTSAPAKTDDTTAPPVDTPDTGGDTSDDDIAGMHGSIDDSIAGNITDPVDNVSTGDDSTPTDAAGMGDDNSGDFNMDDPEVSGGSGSTDMPDTGDADADMSSITGDKDLSEDKRKAFMIKKIILLHDKYEQRIKHLSELEVPGDVAANMNKVLDEYTSVLNILDAYIKGDLQIDSSIIIIKQYCEFNMLYAILDQQLVDLIETDDEDVK